MRLDSTRCKMEKKAIECSHLAKLRVYYITDNVLFVVIDLMLELVEA